MALKELILWILVKSTVSTSQFFYNLIHPYIKPSFTKYYKSHPKLACHFYQPKSKTLNDCRGLYISFHAGGFNLGSPLQDGDLLQRMADKCDVLVVSIGYPLGLWNSFPDQRDSSSDLLAEILDDSELGLTKNNSRPVMVLGGSSSGAVIATQVAQLSRWQGAFKGLCSLSGGPLDFSSSPEALVQDVKANVPKDDPNPDQLPMILPVIRWSVMPRNPNSIPEATISVIRSDPKILPPKILIVTGGFDSLSFSSIRWAEKLKAAGKDVHLHVEPRQAHHFHHAEVMIGVKLMKPDQKRRQFQEQVIFRWLNDNIFD